MPDDRTAIAKTPASSQLRDLFLQALSSGRPNSLATIRKRICKELGYPSGGSEYVLLVEQLDEVRAQLLREGLIDLAKKDKLKLTEAGRIALSEGAHVPSRTAAADIPVIPVLVPESETGLSPDRPDAPIQLNVEQLTANIAISAPDAASSSPLPSGLPALVDDEDNRAVPADAHEAVAEPNVAERIKQLLGTFLAKPYAPLALAVLALLLVVMARSPHLGGLLGAGSMGTALYNKRSGKPTSSPKAAQVVGIAALLFSVVGIGAGWGSPSKSTAVSVAPIPITFDVSDERDYADSIVRQVAEEGDRQEEEARKKAEEEARKKAEEEAARKAAEEEARKKAEEEAARKAAEEEAARKAAEEQARQDAEAAAASASRSVAGGGDDVTVYITDTGSKYHRESCRHLKHSKYPISRNEARAQGYEPCKVCSPG